MLYYQKLSKAINNFNAITLVEDERFFINPVMNQLIIIHDLLIFPFIEHEKFQQYIGLFRNDIRLDINRCLTARLFSSPGENQYLLNSIKGHVNSKLKVVEFAFSYYLNNRNLLNQEGGVFIPKNKRKKFQLIKLPVIWL